MSAGAFQIMNNAQGDILPPGQVTDLMLLERSRADNTVTVSWTAPGADLDQGTGKEADVGYSRTSILCHRELDGCTGKEADDRYSRPGVSCRRVQV